MHANCVAYERMYSTGSGTYANVSTHPLNRTDRLSIRVGWGDVRQRVLNCTSSVVRNDYFGDYGAKVSEWIRGWT
jgi:hypothetical protein